MDRLDLSIEPGEFVALLGANGSGKTTLLRALLKLIPTAHGEISVKAKKIAYVPQRLPAVSGVPISVYESVATGLLDGKLRIFSTKGQKATVNLALKKVGIFELINKSLAKLSGGQLRRTMIAKALVADPDLILLDEPTAGLDHSSQILLFNTLKELKDSGVTIILVTHEIGSLALLVDKVVVLDRKAKNNISYFGKLPVPVDVDPESHHSDELITAIDESVLGLNT
ncbi:MAG: ATP-binding cassette domain-containing protein [Candidatus Nanopelagicales bacterium]